MNLKQDPEPLVPEGAFPKIQDPAPKPPVPHGVFPKIWYWIKWLWEHVYAIGNRASDDQIYLFASGIAFTIITSLVPTVLLLLVVLGYVLDAPTVTRTLDSYANTLIVSTGERQDILHKISGQINALIANRGLAGVLGLIGLLWTASALASSIRSAVNSVLKCQEQRHFLIYKLYDFLVIVAIGLLVFLSVVIGPLLQLLMATTDRIGGLLHLAGLEFLISESLSIGVTLVLFYVIFRFMPYQRQPRRVIIIATVASTFLWIGARYVFTYYLTRFGTSFTKIYGAYAFFAAAAIWIYYSALVFLIGAEIASHVKQTGWDPRNYFSRTSLVGRLIHWEPEKKKKEP